MCVRAQLHDVGFIFFFTTNQFGSTAFAIRSAARSLVPALLQPDVDSVSHAHGFISPAKRVENPPCSFSVSSLAHLLVSVTVISFICH